MESNCRKSAKDGWRPARRKRKSVSFAICDGDGIESFSPREAVSGTFACPKEKDRLRIPHRHRAVACKTGTNGMRSLPQGQGRAPTNCEGGIASGRLSPFEVVSWHVARVATLGRLSCSAGVRKSYWTPFFSLDHPATLSPSFPSFLSLSLLTPLPYLDNVSLNTTSATLSSPLHFFSPSPSS